MTGKVHWLRGIAALATAAVSVAAACSPDEDARLAALGSGCLLDSECDGELVCVFRRCHQACSVSADCPTAERCVLGEPPTHVCLLPDETECVRTSDCAASLICGPDQKCRDECIADPDCVSDQICTQLTCALQSELVDGRLPDVTGSGDMPCVFDSECGAPKRCIDKACRFECIVNEDCPSLTCAGNRCEPLGPVAPLCAPGFQEACACPTGGAGVHICNAEGTGFDACAGCEGAAGPCPPTAGMSDPSYRWDIALDVGSLGAGVYDIAVGPAGELAAVGSFSGTLDLGAQQLTAADATDGLIARYAADGSLVSATAYDVGNNLVEAYAAAYTPSGELWVAGCYGDGGTALNLGGGPLPTGIGMFLARFDAAGNHAFSAGYTITPPSSPSGCFLHDLVVSPTSGRVAVSGNFTGTFDLGTGNISSPNNSTAATFVALFDASGANLMARAIGSTMGSLSSTSLALNSADELLFTSQLLGTLDLGGGPKTAVDGYDVAVAAYDAGGAHLFDAVHDTAGAADNLLFIGAPTADAVGNFLLIGSYDASAPPDLGGGVLPSGAGGAMFELTLDNAGNVTAQTATANAGGSSVELDGLARRLVTGTLSQAATLGPCPLQPAEESFVARRNAGTIDWVRTFPATSSLPTLRSMDANANGDVILMFSSFATATTADFGSGPKNGNRFFVKYVPTP